MYPHKCITKNTSSLSAHHLSPPRSTPRTRPCCRTCWRWPGRSPVCRANTDRWWNQRPRWVAGLCRALPPWADGTQLGRQNRGVDISTSSGLARSLIKHNRQYLWWGSQWGWQQQLLRVAKKTKWMQLHVFWRIDFLVYILPCTIPATASSTWGNGHSKFGGEKKVKMQTKRNKIFTDTE